jgi:hypothetical protein
VLVGRVGKGVERCDRAADAVHVQVEEYADGCRPPLHDLADA